MSDTPRERPPFPRDLRSALGGLLEHLAWVEALTFRTKLLDEPLSDPQDDGHCDLIEESGRHTGHADLLRENVDGRVGEDPPPGWAPDTMGR